ncbi:MAG: zinc ABC transporter substrate-binding protein [Hyphomicrobiaceae bacterium]
MFRAWPRIASFVTALLLSNAAPVVAAAQELNIVVTIRPIHSLTAAVMQGVSEPRLLVEGTASPHTFVMKPSDAKALAGANVLIRVAESLEPFTAKVIPSLPKQVQVVTLEATPGLTLYPLRTGATFEAHEHGPAHKGHGHAHGPKSQNQKGTSSGGTDGHIWLDPENAKLIARHVADVLSAAAPAHADRFRANAAALATRLDALGPELADMVKPVVGRNYLVFHDAYQYFERRYGLTPAGSVTISPDVPASAKRIVALRRKVADLKVTCVFAEPQFTPKLIDPIIEGTTARRGILDPLGAAIPAGPEHYFGLMRGLANDLRACLANPA